MKFIYEKGQENKQLTFGDVENDQLFISQGGYLCQKTDGCRYTSIANESGTLESHTWNGESVTPIQKIFTEITGIQLD